MVWALIRPLTQVLVCEEGAVKSCGMALLKRLNAEAGITGARYSVQSSREVVWAPRRQELRETSSRQLRPQRGSSEDHRMPGPREAGQPHCLCHLHLHPVVCLDRHGQHVMVFKPFALSARDVGTGSTLRVGGEAPAGEQPEISCLDETAGGRYGKHDLAIKLTWVRGAAEAPRKPAVLPGSLCRVCVEPQVLRTARCLGFTRLHEPCRPHP